MTLGELTKVFSNDTKIKISLLSSANSEVIYIGTIYNYSSVLADKWPDNDFKNFDVTNAFIADNVLDVLIES